MFKLSSFYDQENIAEAGHSFVNAAFGNDVWRVGGNKYHQERTSMSRYWTFTGALARAR